MTGVQYLAFLWKLKIWKTSKLLYELKYPNSSETSPLKIEYCRALKRPIVPAMYIISFKEPFCVATFFGCLFPDRNKKAIAIDKSVNISSSKKILFYLEGPQGSLWPRIYGLRPLTLEWALWFDRCRLQINRVGRTLREENGHIENCISEHGTDNIFPRNLRCCLLWKSNEVDPILFFINPVLEKLGFRRIHCNDTYDLRPPRSVVISNFLGGVETSYLFDRRRNLPIPIRNSS